MWIQSLVEVVALLYRKIEITSTWFQQKSIFAECLGALLLVLCVFLNFLDIRTSLVYCAVYKYWPVCTLHSFAGTEMGDICLTFMAEPICALFWECAIYNTPVKLKLRCLHNPVNCSRLEFASVVSAVLFRAVVLLHSSRTAALLWLCILRWAFQ